MTFSDVMTLISNWAIPLVVALVCFWAILKKVPVYSIFTEGAKEGFSTAVMIIPYLTAMLCAIGMFRASGAMDWLCAILDPVTSRDPAAGHHEILLRRRVRGHAC